MKRFILFQTIISLAIILSMNVYSSRADELDGKSGNKQVKGGDSSLQESPQTQKITPPPGGENASKPETGEIYHPVTEGGKEIAPSPEINPPQSGTINPYTERFIRNAPKGSFVDPSTGDIYAPIATGYVNLRTGKVIRK
jgi:hypothetical protein